MAGKGSQPDTREKKIRVCWSRNLQVHGLLEFECKTFFCFMLGIKQIFIQQAEGRIHGEG